MCFSYQLCWYSCAAQDVWDLCSHTIGLAALFSKHVVLLALREEGAFVMRIDDDGELVAVQTET